MRTESDEAHVTLTDEDLLEALRQGDRAAFDALYERYERVDLDGKGLAPDVPVAAEVLPASRLLPLAERLPLDPLLQVAHRLLLERNR